MSIKNTRTSYKVLFGDGKKIIGGGQGMHTGAFWLHFHEHLVRNCLFKNEACGSDIIIGHPDQELHQGGAEERSFAMYLCNLFDDPGWG